MVDVGVATAVKLRARCTAFEEVQATGMNLHVQHCETFQWVSNLRCFTVNYYTL